MNNTKYKRFVIVIFVSLPRLQWLWLKRLVFATKIWLSLTKKVFYFFQIGKIVIIMTVIFLIINQTEFKIKWKKVTTILWILKFGIPGSAPFPTHSLFLIIGNRETDSDKLLPFPFAIGKVLSGISARFAVCYKQVMRKSK